MQDLTGRFLASLAPSSQEGGNMIQEDLPEMTMTAPGSEPVAPLPAAVEGSHPEVNYSGPQVKVSTPGDNPRPAVKPSRDGDTGWTGSWKPAGPWEETP